MGEREGDAAVLRRVGAREKAGVVAVLHVLAIGFEDAGVGTGLRKNFAQHGEIKPKGGSKSEAFGKSGGIDIHHHVDERLHLRRLTRGSDVAQGNTKVLKCRFGALESCIRASGHEIQGSFAGLGDARRHAGFERFGTGLVCEGLDIEVNLRRDGGAVDEKFASGSNKQAIALFGEDGSHGLVVGHDSHNHAGEFIHAGQCFGNLSPDFSTQLHSKRSVVVEDCGDIVSLIFETAGHVGAHATDSNECDGFFHKFFKQQKRD